MSFRQSQLVRNRRPAQAKLAYDSNNRHKKMVVDYLGNGANEEELLDKVAYLADSRCWEVKSTSRGDKTYLVQKISDHCTCSRANIHNKLVLN
ncbi:MAG: hypothetical protein GY820_18755 [Gammaproteobacteria bacterium]|nr:hypothetical protein [Gammaproteobacteria bacterium]